MATIGDYKVIEQIGTGGFSDVYLVEKDGKLYAAKALSLSQQKRKKNNIQSIKKEIKHLQKAKHANIAYLKDLIVSDQNKLELNVDISDRMKANGNGSNSNQRVVYLIQEYAEKSLYEIIFNENAIFMEYKARPIICQILSAISHLHSNGICHRDIKLQNIMLNTITNSSNKDNSYIVKIIDFGFSTSTKPTSFRGGSREFLAPELVASISGQSSSSNFCLTSTKSSLTEEERSKFENDDKNDSGECDGLNLFDGIKCDSFSLGVTFYIMLTGKSPWHNGTNVLEGKVNYPPYLSKGCVDFLSRLLEINPLKRISACDALKHPWLSHDVKRYTRTSFVEPKDNNDRISFNLMNKFLKKELGCKIVAKQGMLYDPAVGMNMNLNLNENENENDNLLVIGKTAEENNKDAERNETTTAVDIKAVAVKKQISGFETKLDGIFKKIALLRKL